MGDTNCDLKKLNYGPKKKLKSVYNEFQFEQQIKNYTRIVPTTNDRGTTETTNSLTDHIATNRLNYIIEAGTLETSFTDHYLVFARRKINARLHLDKKVSFVETRSLSSYDKNFFLADLQSIDWTDAFDGCSNDPARMVEIFSCIFSSVLDVHAP